MIKGSLAAKARGLLGSKVKTDSNGQGGSMLLEAIIVLGMIASFTPLLYKHVADRRADIENINRANTLLYLQQKTEDFLKNPENITELVDELGHNQHKEIFPSELGIGDNFDGRYIIGIRREDEENQPILKAMIIDTVNTGSDVRAAKVAELIGVSAGIYTAVDPDSAWGINGLWSEPLSRYFDTEEIPTGAVVITTEYNKEKYRVNISDILVDSDLDLGEFDLTAEQINAINIAAENGTIGELIAKTKITSPKFVATGNFCFEKDGVEQCIDSWKGLGGGEGQKNALQLVQECNVGITDSCMEAFAYNLNTSCSKVDAVYNQFGQTYPTPKIYNITYGTGGTYDGSIRVKCEGTQFVVSGISSQNLSNPVEQVGDTAFGITQPGWYQITLMGEAGISGGVADSGGGILIANTYYNADTLITIKGIKGNTYASTDFGGAGVALWNEIDITGVPTLTAGGGCGGSDNGGGGIVGGWQHRGDGLGSSGYSYTGSRGNNQSYCSGGNNYCSTAGGGMKWGSSPYVGFGGTGSSLSDCISGGFNNCAIIAGGQAVGTSTGSDYLASTYGNWGTNTLTGGKGYASIVYCGASQSDCPVACSSDSDCSSGECNFSTGLCANACNSIAACNNGDASFCALLYRNGINTSCANLVASCSDLSYPTAAKICYSETNCVETCCSSSSLTLPKNQEYVVSDSISTLSNYSAVYNLATIPICAGQFRFNLMGEGGVWSSYSPNTWNAAGGGRIVTKSFTENTNITFKVAPGGYNSSTKMGGAGVGIYEGSEIKVAVGGGGSYGPAGGGYQTGALQSGGTSGKGFVSGVAWCYCNNSDPSNCDWAFGCGGMGNNGGWPSGHVWGGSAFLDPSYTQESYTIGGNYTRDPYKYSTASWGNHGPGWAKMTFLGM